jgi:putative ABC transport system ATP-binding protein/lipoprotein-releasing system ATP-binding protein
MIQVKNLNKSLGDPPVQVLFDINLEIASSTFASISGRSGSGKSTLLYLLSSLDSPTSGQVLLDGTDIAGLSDKELHEFRNLNMGFIFQFHYLLPELTALENVLMPARRTHQHLKRMEFAKHLLSEFGLSDTTNGKSVNKFGRLPKELSGGEQQRVAIARALIMEPKYLFADEPTGNLDSANGNIVMDILQKASTEKKTTVLYVTHDVEYAKLAQERIHLADGRTV